MVSLCNKSPFSSKQTTLQPVRYPGSMAKIRFSPKGGANNNCRKFSENTAMALLSALALAYCRVSFEIAGSKKRL